MMLRLVLVGAVAALGVSVPGEPSCKHWYESAQAWATSLLAEWDTWTAIDESEPRLPMTANHMACEECRLARMRLVAQANENLRKDAVLTEAKAGTKATENKPSPADSNESAPTAAQTDVVCAEESDFPMTEQSFICGFGAFDLAERNVRGSANPAAERQSQLDMGVDLDESGGDAMSCLDEALSWDEEAEVVVAAARVDPFLADLPADVFVPEQVTVEISAPATTSIATNEAPLAAVAPDAPRPVVLAVLADLPSDVFVPMPQPSDRDSLAKDRPLAGAEPCGVALAMPVDLLAKDRPLAGAEPQPARLGDAVELTRKAVSAWVSVLIGPALVGSSRR